MWPRSAARAVRAQGTAALSGSGERPETSAPISRSLRDKSSTSRTVATAKTAALQAQGREESTAAVLAVAGSAPGAAGVLRTCGPLHARYQTRSTLALSSAGAAAVAAAAALAPA